MKKVPLPGDASAAFAALEKRQADLMAQRERKRRELSETHQKIAESGPVTVQREDRIRALLQGVTAEPPADLRDTVSALAREVYDLDSAIEHIASDIRIERLKVSADVAADFKPEYSSMAREFFGHLAKAAEAHNKLGELHREFLRAGLEPAGLSDFGRDLFGSPMQRNSDVGISLRHAVRDGLLDKKDLPEVFR
ncbi:hypothetical protein [Ciceribacter sp. L1K22]|uniref:hypothetical protein n=1 Tax=Ciceribacter sp. L1K22 TaxID=2820275 RepID=UPI001ABEE532|nr:hypothetical protein [Ciceribacter sp. L1K22]MBO3760030.1 hypothetical protein [Ciceribacter sp. L1K22]